MAKKGGVQQLQADINTDEEFEKFIERPGLLVLDVYSEWCGPCLGMIGSLKKIKLELGGDNLQLAVCKSDTITYLKRFRKKSEPTWLFITRGKAVNLMFGTNVPKLVRVIAMELELLTSQEPRTSYEITELQPEEQERQRIKEEVNQASERIERLDREKKRREYLMSVTDKIMENLPDFGVTVFGPQVNRDMLKKIMEPADILKIQCKDRRVLPVTMEHFETINFASSNRLPLEVIEQMDKKELLTCFWKVPDDENVPEALNAFAVELTKPRLEASNEKDVELPPIIGTLEVEVTFEKPDSRQSIEIVERTQPTENVELCEYDRFDEKLDQADLEQPLPDTGDINIELDEISMHKDEISEDKDENRELKAVVVEETPPLKRLSTKKVKLPAIWVPNDQRTHAALIYVFFRPQTAAFLAPDPEPEPPHIVMAFDAYKKKDLIDLSERLKDDVPLYGFFTSDIPGEAKFIANSVAKYTQYPHQPTDKLVFKVNKQTSDAMLQLALYGPSHVSTNTVVGRQEALKFFPVGYKTAEQELFEAQQSAAQLLKKRRKSKKAHPAGIDTETPQPGTVASGSAVKLASATGEETISTSGDDSFGSEENENMEDGAEQLAELSTTGVA